MKRMKRMKLLNFLIALLMSCGFCQGEEQVDVAVEQLQNLFQEAESQSEPASGYRATLIYNKTSNDFQVALVPYGKRQAGTTINMPALSHSPFDSISLKFKDRALNRLLEARNIKVVRSMSNRLLLVPVEHIPHWFEASPSQQRDLLYTALSMSQSVEAKFPELMTTYGLFIFELHIGIGAGQTVSHLHLRFESGPKQGRLTDQEWQALLEIRGMD